MELYEFEPLKDEQKLEFADGSTLNLPKGTYYVGYEEFE